MASEEARNIVFKIREEFVAPACSGIKFADLPEALRDFQNLCRKTMDAYEAKKVAILFSIRSFTLLSLPRSVLLFSTFSRRALRSLNAFPLNLIMLMKYVSLSVRLLPSKCDKLMHP